MQGTSLAGRVPAELLLWMFPRSVLGSIWLWVWRALSGRLTCSFSFPMPVDSADPLHLAVVLLTQKQSVAWGWGGEGCTERKPCSRRLAGVLK